MNDTCESKNLEEGDAVWCSHEVRPDPFRNGPATCTRRASRIVHGRSYCWQHAEATTKPHMHWEEEERDLAHIRTAAPRSKAGKDIWRVRMLYALGLTAWADKVWKNLPRDKKYRETCGYCDCRATTTLLVVNPLTLQRSKYPMCRGSECQQKLKAWEGSSNARRSRAQMDWEHERGIESPYDLAQGIPTQYPSVSRATLRAFLDSGLSAATVTGAGERTVAALNGSIRTLGFADQVYAEVRSGEAVLRRMEQATV